MSDLPNIHRMEVNPTKELEKPRAPGAGFLEYKMISGTWSGGALYGVVLYQNEFNEFVGVNEYR